MSRRIRIAVTSRNDVTCKRRGEVPVVGNGVVEFTCMKLSDCSHMEMMMMFGKRKNIETGLIDLCTCKIPTMCEKNLG